MNRDGTGRTQLTHNTYRDWKAAWSPDGRKITFTSDEGGGDEEIFVMNAEGTGRTALTSNTNVHDTEPSWQPIPYTGHPRPKSATPTYASLVPAFNACTTPDRTHGPPLAYGSCSTPTQVSPHVTIGTPDANGQPAKSTGYVRYDSLRGDPATPADEADVRFWVRIDDIRKRSDLTDYEGELELRTTVRATDRIDEPMTTQDFELPVTVPCTATADTTIGARCEVRTSADAVTPGTVTEGARSVWGFDRARLYTPDGALFAVQGIFVP